MVSGETVPGDQGGWYFQEDTVPGLFRICEILVGTRSITWIFRIDYTVQGDPRRGRFGGWLHRAIRGQCVLCKSSAEMALGARQGCSASGVTN